MKMSERGRPVRIFLGRAGVLACVVRASGDACFTHGWGTLALPMYKRSTGYFHPCCAQPIMPVNMNILPGARAVLFLSLFGLREFTVGDVHSYAIRIACACASRLSCAAKNV